MPPTKSINIDEKFDLVQAKLLIENGYCKNIPQKEIKIKHIKKKENRIAISTPMHFMTDLKEKFEGLGSCNFCHGATKNEIKKILDDAYIWVCAPSPTYKIDKNIFKNSKNLKYIITPSTGSNHISLKDCKKKGIKVISIKNSKNIKQITASSEFTFAIFLSLIKKIQKGVETVRAGHWRDMEDNLRGYELKDKKVGIIGFGRIGSNIAKYSKAFKMKVISYDPNIKIKNKSVLQYSSINKILANSDIIFICVHLNKKNKKNGK